ncbi:MAG: ABC transporter permease [Firmicutes bacterium]|nr:ABC transporter permease [Bacillota bacterium]
MKKKNKWKERLHECIHNANFMIGFVIIVSVILVAIFADQIAPFDYAAQKTGGRLEAPSSAHLFGTDDLGRDMFSRIVYGSRIALWVAFLGGSLQLAIGVVIGLACGFFGKWVDRVLTFMTDLTWCIPGTILALAVVTILGKSLTNTIIAISLVAWASYARIVRAKTMSLRNMAFVETGKAFGESNVALMMRYILPNVIPSLLVMVSLNLPGTIMSTTTLSFLGLGSQPPSPDWGLAISLGLSYIQRAPWLTIWPGIALVYVTFGFNLLGEGLRDLIDPHMKTQ